MTPACIAARAWTSLRSRRSGAELISSIVCVRAAASMTASMSSAYGWRDVILRPVGWPIASIHGCSIAATMRFVISAPGMPNDVCTDAITQPSWASRSSS